jgi:hypothetical protein
MFKRVLAILKAISTAIGNLVGRIILTIFYFVLLPPFALWSRRKTDPLRIKPTNEGPWTAREPVEEGLDAALRQY